MFKTSIKLKKESGIYQCLDLKQLYDDGKILPEIKDPDVRKWLLQQEKTSNPEDASFDEERKLQLFFQFMELNNPRSLEETSLYNYRVEYCFSELEDFMVHIEENLPQHYRYLPFSSIEISTFYPGGRHTWTQFQVILVVFFRRFLETNNFDYVTKMINECGIRQDDDDENESQTPNNYSFVFIYTMKHCLNLIYQNLDTVDSWFASDEET